MSDTHLSNIERSKREMLYQQGKSARVIAKELNRHHATISRELSRNKAQSTYRAKSSQEGDVRRRKASIPVGKWTSALA